MVLFAAGVAGSPARGQTLPAPLRADAPSAPLPSHPTSLTPRTAALLAAATPKLPPPPLTPTGRVTLVATASAESSAGDVVQMPHFLVREAKIPSVAEVEPGTIARRAMDKYLGPEDGLDRGFLNLITSEQFWPLALVGSVSNETRAMQRYREDQRIEFKRDLEDLARLSALSGDAAAARKIKRETQAAFQRDN